MHKAQTLTIGVLIALCFCIKADARQDETFACGSTRTETLSVTSSTAVGISPHAYSGIPEAVAARVYVETAAVRYRLDGTNPTTSVGEPLAVGDRLYLENGNDISRARFIATSTTASLFVEPRCE